MKYIVITAMVIAPIWAEELPETIISASRTEEFLYETPYNVSIFSEDGLLDGAVRTLPEALKNTPSVMIQKTTHGHGSPYIRGFTGRQNLLLVDGVRINNSTFRSGPVQYWNTVDSSAVARLELVRGQGSVLYGSDAIGGTLNTLTRSSNFLDYEGRFSKNTLSYRFDTNSQSHVSRIETAFGEGAKWGILLGVTNKNFGDIKDSSVGRMKHTGYDEIDFDFRFDYALSEASTLTLAHQRVNQDNVWRWHSTKFNPGWNHKGHTTTAGSFNARILDQERSLTYLKLISEEADGWLTRWEATVSYQKSQDSSYQDRSATDRRTQNIDLDTWGLTLQMESSVGEKGSLVYGFDYYRDSVDSSGTRTGKDPRSRRPVADDSTYDLLGVYAQYRWNPIATLPKLQTTVGLRYTYADAQLGKNWDSASSRDISADKSWSNWVFSARALYSMSDMWNIYSGVSQGVRAPNLNDLSGNLTTRSGLTSLGSLDLEPEKFTTYEIGTRYHTDSMRLSVSAYLTDIERVIIGVPASAGSGTDITTNGQSGQIVGVELQGGWDISDQWTISAQASWQEGDTRSAVFIGGPESEDYISRLAPLMGSLSLKWTHPGKKFWIESRVTAAATADKLSARDRGDSQRIPTGGTPSYVVASLYAGWQATDTLRLTLGLENLTDEDYRIHGSGQNEQGFNVIMGAKLEF